MNYNFDKVVMLSAADKGQNADFVFGKNPDSETIQKVAIGSDAPLQKILKLQKKNYDQWGSHEIADHSWSLFLERIKNIYVKCGDSENPICVDNIKPNELSYCTASNYEIGDVIVEANHDQIEETCSPKDNANTRCCFLGYKNRLQMTSYLSKKAEEKLVMTVLQQRSKVISIPKLQEFLFGIIAERYITYSKNNNLIWNVKDNSEVTNAYLYGNLSFSLKKIRILQCQGYRYSLF